MGQRDVGMVFRRSRCGGRDDRQHQSTNLLESVEKQTKKGNETVTICNRFKMQVAYGKMSLTYVPTTDYLESKDSVEKMD